MKQFGFKTSNTGVFFPISEKTCFYLVKTLPPLCLFGIHLCPPLTRALCVFGACSSNTVMFLRRSTVTFINSSFCLTRTPSRMLFSVFESRDRLIVARSSNFPSEFGKEASQQGLNLLFRFVFNIFCFSFWINTLRKTLVCIIFVRIN
jgi:hypothetical protein